MRLGITSILGIVGVTVLASMGACSSSSSNGGTSTNPDAGDDDAAATGSAFTFQPQGCGYAVFVPQSRGFTEFSQDDASGATAAAGAAPARVRIGLGGNASFGKPGYADPSTTAAFTWETPASTHAAKVKLGTDPSALSEVHAGYSWSSPPPTVGLGSNDPAIFLHEVHVCGLKPGTTYYYQVGGGAAGSEVWSATQTFTTVPTTGKISIGLLGDARDSVNVWQLVHLRMRDAGVNLQLISGDLVDIGTMETFYTAALDAAWKDPQDPSKFLTLGQQMMVAIAGNHENEASRFFANFAIPGDGPYAETFTSFGVGGAHVVMLDDEQIATADPKALNDQANAQLAWLEQDLAAADGDRANHPFVIAVNHRGLYSTANHGADSDVLQTKAKLAPLFDKYHVDLVVNGHDHEFERTKTIRAGSVPAGDPVVQPAGSPGTVYLISAGAGADAYVGGKTPSEFRATNTNFGNGTAYVGVYSIATLDGSALTVKTYGLKQSGGGVAGDDLVDTLTLTH